MTSAVVFAFRGFGPQQSQGLAVAVDDTRIMIADAPDNPGTSVASAPEAAADEGKRALRMPPDARVVLYRPQDPHHPHGLWEVRTAGREHQLVALAADESLDQARFI